MTSTKRILITGANAGIGFSAARQLVAAGHRVVLGCRDGERAAIARRDLISSTGAASGMIDVLQIDMSSQVSVAEAAGAVGELDGVIHNAAFFDIASRTRQLSVDGVELTWATNHLGPVLLTELLLPQLRTRNDARIIVVTSKGLAVTPRLAIDLDDVGFERRRFSVPRAYYQSKLAQLAWMLDLAERLADSTVHVHGVRVTNVKVDLGRYPQLGRLARAAYALKSRFAISADEMARTYVWLATSMASPAMKTGGYYDRIDAPAPVSRWAQVPANRQALVALTASHLRLHTRALTTLG